MADTRVFPEEPEAATGLKLVALGVRHRGNPSDVARKCQALELWSESVLANHRFSVPQECFQLGITRVLFDHTPRILVLAELDEL